MLLLNVLKILESFKQSKVAVIFRSNAIAQKISLGKFGHVASDNKVKGQEALKPIEDEFTIIQGYDKIYTVYLRILYEYYVNSKFVLTSIENILQMKKLIQSIDKADPATLYVLIEVWNIISKEGNYLETKAIAKFIYRLLKYSFIPNHLWIKGHIICAKTLLKAPKPNCDDAINLLKNLCQILPALPLPESIYSIQKNLKINEPIRAPNVVADSLFGASPFGVPESQPKPTAVQVVSVDMPGGTVPSRPQGLGMSMIDDENAKYMRNLRKQGTQQLNEEGEFAFENELMQMDDPKPGQSPSILDPGMRKCSIYYQQMALYQECNKPSKVYVPMPSFRVMC